MKQVDQKDFIKHLLEKAKVPNPKPVHLAEIVLNCAERTVSFHIKEPKK